MVEGLLGGPLHEGLFWGPSDTDSFKSAVPHERTPKETLIYLGFRV